MIFQPQLGTLSWQLLGFLSTAKAEPRWRFPIWRFFFKWKHKRQLCGQKKLKNLFRMFFSVYANAAHQRKTWSFRPNGTQPEGDHLQRLFERLWACQAWGNEESYPKTHTIWIVPSTWPKTVDGRNSANRLNVVGQITILTWLVGFLRHPVAIDPLLPVVGICWIFGHTSFAMITVPRQWQRALVTLEEMQREDLTLGKPEWGWNSSVCRSCFGGVYICRRLYYSVY